MINLGLLTFLLLYSKILAENTKFTNCWDYSTYNECVQSTKCSWCPKDFQSNSKCIPTDLMISRCESLSELTVLKDEPLTMDDGKVVQISPQRVSLSLAVGQSYRVDFSYSRALDFPLDLYLLVDGFFLSQDKEKIKTLAKNIIKTMQNTTKDFRLGFGVFENHLFFNHMPLNSNVTDFEENIHKFILTSDYTQSPKLNFQPILQAVVCYEEINWRTQARRILVVATSSELDKNNNESSTNDNECYLNRTTQSRNQPTLTQINEKVRENAINIIFTTTVDLLLKYGRMASSIDGSYVSSLTGELDHSSMIGELIRMEYMKISSTIMLKDNSSEPITVKYYSGCLNDMYKSTNKCSYLKIGDKINFQAKISATSCPEDPHQTVMIYPVGENESLIIDINLICSSDKSTQAVLDSSKCMMVDSDLICSGRGKCISDVCECDMRQSSDEVIYGKFCECDNYSCEHHNGLICSGFDKGRCECGSCICTPGWTGVACSFPHI